MQVPCPKCTNAILLDEAQRDEHGRVRGRCVSCGAQVLVKVNRPALRVSSDIPSHSTMPAVRDEDIASITAASGAFAPIDPEGGEPAEVGGLAPWAFVVDQLAAERLEEARRVFRTLPRFRRQPQRVDELGGEWPWWVKGVTRKEARFLLEKLEELGGEGRAKEEKLLLDERGRPVPVSQMSDEDEEEAFDGESLADEDGWTEPLPRPDGAVEEEAAPARSAEPKAPADPKGVARPTPAIGLARDPKKGDLLLLTAESAVKVARVLGLVKAVRLIGAAQLDSTVGRTALVLEALHGAEKDLGEAAKAVGADTVIGVRVEQGPVPAGEAGLDWVVVMMGTAVVRG